MLRDNPESSYLALKKNITNALLPISLSCYLGKCQPSLELFLLGERSSSNHLDFLLPYLSADAVVPANNSLHEMAPCAQSLRGPRVAVSIHCFAHFGG